MFLKLTLICVRIRCMYDILCGMSVWDQLIKSLLNLRQMHWHAAQLRWIQAPRPISHMWFPFLTQMSKKKPKNVNHLANKKNVRLYEKQHKCEGMGCVELSCRLCPKSVLLICLSARTTPIMCGLFKLEQFKLTSNFISVRGHIRCDLPQHLDDTSLLSLR